jgi:hypothetical protein
VQGTGEVLSGDLPERRTHRLEHCREVIDAGDCCAELDDIALVHACQVVQVDRRVRRDTGEQSGGLASVWEQGGAGQRMRAAAGPAERDELRGSNRLQDDLSIGSGICDAAAWLCARLPIPRTGIAHRAYTERGRGFSEGTEDQVRNLHRK